MRHNNFMNELSINTYYFLSAFLIAILLAGCGGTQTQAVQKNVQPTQINKTSASQDISVQVLEYALIKSIEKLPFGGQQFQITNNKISNNQQVLGPPDNEVWAKDGHQFVVLSVNIATQNEREWIEIVTSAQLVEQNGKSKYADLWYFNGAFRPRTLLTFGLSGFNPGQQTKLAFHMQDPLPPKLKVKIQNREMGFLEDM